jgi:hypothetical protein
MEYQRKTWLMLGWSTPAELSGESDRPIFGVWDWQNRQVVGKPHGLRLGPTHRRTSAQPQNGTKLGLVKMKVDVNLQQLKFAE